MTDKSTSGMNKASRFSSDYSRFDQIKDSDSEDEDNVNRIGDSAAKVEESSSTTQRSGAIMPESGNRALVPSDEAQRVLNEVSASSSVQVLSKTKKGSEKGRYVFEHNGQKIYEWDQNLDEVNIYIDAPPGVTSAHSIICEISATHLKLGLRGSKGLYLDEDTYGKVLKDESSWYLNKEEDGTHLIYIVLMKALRGETWESCLKGNSQQFVGNTTVQVDAATKEEIQQNMLLERFQEEHPGFDFRDAKFNGSAPDPRTFLDGIKHN